MLIEIAIWTMLTTSLHLYAECLDSSVYIEADQEKIYRALEEETQE